jgi:hypothetical protein
MGKIVVTAAHHRLLPTYSINGRLQSLTSGKNLPTSICMADLGYSRQDVYADIITSNGTRQVAYSRGL